MNRPLKKKKNGKKRRKRAGRDTIFSGNFKTYRSYNVQPVTGLHVHTVYTTLQTRRTANYDRPDGRTGKHMDTERTPLQVAASSSGGGGDGSRDGPGSPFPGQFAKTETFRSGHIHRCNCLRGGGDGCTFPTVTTTAKNYFQLLFFFFKIFFFFRIMSGKFGVSGDGMYLNNTFFFCKKYVRKTKLIRNNAER